MPAELIVVTNSDGTSSIVPNPYSGLDISSNATVTPEGSLVLPPGSDIKQNADGSVSLNGKVLPPGTQVQKLPDGSIMVQAATTQPGVAILPKSSKVSQNPDGTFVIDGKKLPPGTQVVQNPDGSYLVTDQNNNPTSQLSVGQGSPVTPPGVVTLPKDTVITRTADGLIVVAGAVMPPGTSVEVSADGSVILDTRATQQLLPPGTKLSTNKDGTVCVDGKALPPGTKTVTNPDGSISLLPPPPPQQQQVSVERQPDGSLALGNIKLPKGSSQNVDGSISLAATAKVSTGPDGSTLVDGKKLPPGLAVVKNSDGSLAIVSSQSNPNMKANSDGTLSLGDVKLPKGSSGNLDGSITLPKGSKITKGPDGSLRVNGKELPAGFDCITNKDGTLTIVPLPPNVQREKDGSVSVGNIKLPAGTTPNQDGSLHVPANADIISKADGSLTLNGKTFPPGTKCKVNADGSKTIVLPKSSGSVLNGAKTGFVLCMACLSQVFSWIMFGFL